MKWAIIVPVVLALALAGSTAYLGYGRIFSDDDGGRESERLPASEVARVTPTATPSIDLELSRRCFDAWAELDTFSMVLSFAIGNETEGVESRDVLDAALGPDWVRRTNSATQLWQVTCLSPSVVPVPNPVNDINVLCVAARAEALRMSGESAEELEDWDAARLTVLQTFVRSRCP